jgi:hypothetical protein
MSERAVSAPNENEQNPMTTTAEVAALVHAVQRKARGRIRWSVGKHTAEMALRALETPEPRRPPSAKSRRRKRHKRLL